MNTALNRTGVVFLTNESGGDVAQGDVVIVDDANAGSFTTTTTGGFSDSQVGVVLDVNGIANNATGAVAFSGWVPVINLDGAATLGDFVKTDTVAGQGTPHAAPQEEGDFAQVLAASATPAAILFGSPNGPGGGGTVTVDTNAGLDGDGSGGDPLVVKVDAATIDFNVSGELEVIGGGGGALVLVEQHTASNSAALNFTTGITSTYDDYLVRLTNVVPATGAQSLVLQFSTDGGSSYDTGSNYQHFNFRYGTNTSGTGGSTADTWIDLTFGSGASLATTASKGGLSGQFTLVNPLSGSINTQVTNGSAMIDAGTAGAFTGLGGVFSGHYTSATAVNAFRVIFTSGNITSGVVRLYGVAK